MSPYIRPEQRDKWEQVIAVAIRNTQGIEPRDLPGELNFLLTSILHGVYTPSYHNYNEIVGMLECVKLELYRRQIGNYEDQKIRENGDVP
jgi:hypothetical protein